MRNSDIVDGSAGIPPCQFSKMIPIRDDAPRYTTPYVNNFLIGLNSVVFLLMWLANRDTRQAFVDAFGFIPAKVTALLHGYQFIHLQGQDLPVTAVSAFVPALTSMFMHATWLHLIFNMWVLWIFGDNVEDYLGHFRYLTFYLLCGFGADALHTLLNLNSGVPSVGASGAIAGVMGAYLLLFPHARVTTLVWLFVFVTFIRLPAWLVLGYWFIAQFLSGTATSIASANQSGGGIAFWAHVGGFISGLGLIKVFPVRRRRFGYSAW